MDFKKLEVFCKVYELKSFSKAALQSYLTQPTVSGYIAFLEEVFGTKLFDRLGKQISPTKAGETLYTYAKKILATKEEAEKDINLLLGRKKGKLKLGGSTIPGQYILPSFLGRFKSTYPGCKISLSIGDTKQIVHMTLNGEIEIGAVGAKFNIPKLNFQSFAKDELILAVSSDNPLSEIPHMDLNALKKVPFILREPGSGTRMTMERILGEKGIDVSEMNIVAELGSTEAVRQAVMAGIGVSILSKRAVEIEINTGLIKEIKLDDIEIKRDFYLVYHNQKTLSPLAIAFLEFLEESEERI